MKFLLHASLLFFIWFSNHPSISVERYIKYENAVVNTAVNHADVSSKMKGCVDIYNGAMGLIGVYHVGKGVVNFATKLTESTKDVLRQNQSLQAIIKSKYLDWQAEIAKLGDLTPEELKLKQQQEQVWRILGVAEKSIKTTFDDALLNAAKSFDDNALDIASVGFQNWKIFQNRVAEQLQILHPGKKIGNQITLDVTYIENGITKTKTIIPDNLIQIEVNGVKKYKVIDAKTSQTDLVNKVDLTSTCTPNQQVIYKMIDGDATAGTIVKVEMRGKQATDAFGFDDFVDGKRKIHLETGVEFWVNASPLDFAQYLIRKRIK